VKKPTEEKRANPGIILLIIMAILIIGIVALTPAWISYLDSRKNPSMIPEYPKSIPHETIVPPDESLPSIRCLTNSEV